MKSVFLACLYLGLSICPAIAQDLSTSKVRPDLPYREFGAPPAYLDDADGLCPRDAVDEGEPSLVEGYLDAYNGGCNSHEFGIPFQEITWTNDDNDDPDDDGAAWLCGTSGWYMDPDSLESRDTDWFRVIARQDGMMSFTAESEQPCIMFKLGPENCRDVDYELWAVCWSGNPQTLTFPVTAGEEVWLWVAPESWIIEFPDFNYFMTVTNNTFDTVPNEAMNWGTVKGLYR